MIPFAILAFLVGAVLGMRWRVLILIPTCTLLAIAAVAIDLIPSGPGLATIVLDVVTILVAHQAGYLFGALAHGYLAHGPRERAALRARARA